MKKYLFFLFSIVLFTACSEEDDTVDEYANWPITNTLAFQNKFKQALASDKEKMDTIRSYSLQSKRKPSPVDFIVIERIDTLKELADKFNAAYPALAGKSPKYTSTASVSYRGWLLPSLSHPSGVMFDKSFNTPVYDPTIAKPKAMSCNSLIGGFTTALMNMKVGDHWYVYIPHQLAYGAATSGSVPAYSMLKFEIVLESYK